MHRALRLSAFVLGQPAVPNTRGAGSLAVRLVSSVPCPCKRSKDHRAHCDS